MRILIKDDHPLIVEGIAAALGETEGAVEVFSARDNDAALAMFHSHAPIDLVLADLAADEMELVRRFRAIASEVPVVVLSAEAAREAVLGAIEAGAMGFIPKQSSTPVLVGAIRLVLSGGVYVPPQALLHASAAPRLHTPRRLRLTERQTEVLSLLLEGKPNKLICRELNVSEGTVKTHVSAILRALNVSNRAQVSYALSRMGVPLPGSAVSASGAPLAQQE